MQGVRILDLGRVLAGPWATQILADQGADVIKVEPPGGDETRAFEPAVDGVSTYFLSVNRNKRSIVLDLTTEAGQSVLQRLVASSDVVLENFRPGVAARLGLDWAGLEKAHPRLIYVAIHAFGDAGPLADRPGYDMVLQAAGGAMSFTGRPGDPPLRSGAPVADLVAGLLAAQAMTAGLFDRERTGRGQRIVVNMMAAQVASLVYHGTRQMLTGESETQRGNAHRGLVPYDVFSCVDGHVVVACGNDRMWARLRVALGLEDVPAWRTNRGRVAAREAVDSAIASVLAPLTVAAADQRLAAAGVPAGAVLNVEAAVNHPAVANVTVTHDRLGRIPLPTPALVTRTSRFDHRAPPELGADRDAILSDLGYDEGAMAQLAAQGAFGP